MKFEVNVNKRVGIGIVVSVLVLAGVLLVLAYGGPIPNPGHGADTVWVDTDGISGNGEIGEMTLQAAFDSASIPSATLCSDDVGASGICFEASQYEGAGNDKARAVNCLNPGSRAIGRGIRYLSSKWQYYGGDSLWHDCQEGSTLVVRMGS